jgi:hypothetical protein
MQAFLYRHLVPAQELVLTPVSDPAPLSFEVRLPKSGIIQLPLGKATQIPLMGWMRDKQMGANVSIDTPPEGLTVTKGWIGRRKGSGPKHPEAFGTLTVKADAPLKPGDRLTLVPVATLVRGKEKTVYPAPAVTAEVVAAPAP